MSQPKKLCAYCPVDDDSFCDPLQHMLRTVPLTNGILAGHRRRQEFGNRQNLLRKLEDRHSFPDFVDLLPTDQYKCAKCVARNATKRKRSIEMRKLIFAPIKKGKREDELIQSSKDFYLKWQPTITIEGIEEIVCKVYGKNGNEEKYGQNEIETKFQTDLFHLSSLCDHYLMSTLNLNSLSLCAIPGGDDNAQIPYSLREMLASAIALPQRNVHLAIENAQKMFERHGIGIWKALFELMGRILIFELNIDADAIVEDRPRPVRNNFLDLLIHFVLVRRCAFAKCQYPRQMRLDKFENILHFLYYGSGSHQQKLSFCKDSIPLFHSEANGGKNQQQLYIDLTQGRIKEFFELFKKIIVFFLNEPQKCFFEILVPVCHCFAGTLHDEHKPYAPNQLTTALMELASGKLNGSMANNHEKIRLAQVRNGRGEILAIDFDEPVVLNREKHAKCVRWWRRQPKYKWSENVCSHRVAKLRRYTKEGQNGGGARGQQIQQQEPNIGGGHGEWEMDEPNNLLEQMLGANLEEEPMCKVTVKFDDE